MEPVQERRKPFGIKSEVVTLGDNTDTVRI